MVKLRVSFRSQRTNGGGPWPKLAHTRALENLVLNAYHVNFAKHVYKMPTPEEATSSTHSDGEEITFKDLGVIDPLLEALEKMDFNQPTEIQVRAIPPALQGRDIIGVAETGSGKTAAFALPILQKLWDDPKGLFACVLAPTRELAYQIAQQFDALGAAMGVRCAVIVGGMDTVAQAVALAKRPHIVVATPGRLNDHLENTKGFSLRGAKYLVRPGRPCVLVISFMGTIRSWMKPTGCWTWTLVL